MNITYIHNILDRKASLDGVVRLGQVYARFSFHCEENVLLMTGSELNFAVVMFLTETTERANTPPGGKAGGQDAS